MAIPLNVNGAVFEYPENFDENWGINATGWAQAVTNGMLQRAGGNFPLLADVNFGSSFGLISLYYKSRSTPIASTGTVRLASADPGVAFRNNANSANLVLTTDTSDNLTYNGQIIPLSGGGSGSNPSFTSVTVSPTGVILQDSEGTPKTVTLQAPTTLLANWDLKFPVNAGSNGQVLSTDGSGVTSWINAAGGGTVNSGVAGNFSYYATTGTAISDSGISIIAPVFTGFVESAGITLTQATNQLQFHSTGNQVQAISVTATSTAGEVFTVPDPGTSANFILSEGTPTFGVDLDMGSHRIHNITNPSAAQDAATKTYVDSAIPVYHVPTLQRFTSGSGTYTTPTSPAPLYLKVRMVGGGGGGGGGASGSPGNGTAGTATIFGAILTANGGSGSSSAGVTSASAGGAGGATSAVFVTEILGITGGNGQSGIDISSIVNLPGGIGGATPLSGGARGNIPSYSASGSTTAGQNGQANTGEGGQGASNDPQAGSPSSGGGGGGGYLEVIISSPASSYAYAVGAGGTGGTAGSIRGAVGGNGGSGLILVEEYYQ